MVSTANALGTNSPWGLLTFTTGATSTADAADAEELTPRGEGGAGNSQGTTDPHGKTTLTNFRLLGGQIDRFQTESTNFGPNRPRSDP